MPVINVEGFEHCICHNQSVVNLYGCSIGAGTKIGAFVEIGQGASIGARCKIQTGAFIPPGTIIGHSVFIGPHVVICNSRHPMSGEPFEPVTILDHAVIGANVTVLPGVTIGKRAMVGAGSVVTKDVADGQTVIGNHAK